MAHFFALVAIAEPWMAIDEHSRLLMVISDQLIAHLSSIAIDNH